MGGGDDEGDGDGGDGGDGGGDGGDDGGGGDGQDFGDVNFEYWNIINIQARPARSRSEQIIQDFENDTGATINTNFSSYTDLAGAQWINRFQEGNYPVLYDSIAYLSGHLVDGGWVLPLTEYQDRFENEEILDQVEWVTSDASQDTYRGFEGNGLERVYELPFGMDTREPHVIRTDHYEEAGLDPEEELPADDLDHHVEIAQTLQENGPADVTLPVFGADHDWCDVQLVPWNVNNYGTDGLLLNEDWSDANFTNDAWMDTYERYVNMFLEHGFSGPDTPTGPDEDVVPEMVSGNWSQGWLDPFNHGEFMGQGEGLMLDGTIQYNQMFDGPESQGMNWSYVSLGVTRAPEDADEATWERRQDAAIAFMERWLESSFQVETFNDFGTLPVVQDVWEDLPDEEHGLADFLTSTAEQSEYSVGAHPQMSRIYSTLNAPHSQEVLQGNIDYQEGLEQMQEETRDVLGRWAEE